MIGAFEKRLGGCIRGFTMLIVGLLTYVGLTLLEFFCLPLALLAGLWSLFQILVHYFLNPGNNCWSDHFSHVSFRGAYSVCGSSAA